MKQRDVQRLPYLGAKANIQEHEKLRKSQDRENSDEKASKLVS